MELFIIYVITRLTELKATLSTMTKWMAFALILTIALKVMNELLVDAKYKKPATPEDGDLAYDAYCYRRVKAMTTRGLVIFGTLFTLVITTNMFLPTSRDAVVIAGGYGLVEAVKNERVQTLFQKSASVAGHWLDEQLNGEPEVEPEKPAKETKSSNKKSTDKATSEESTEDDTKAAVPAEKLDPKAVAVKVADKVVERVSDRVTEELLGPAKK